MTSWAVILTAIKVIVNFERRQRWTHKEVLYSDSMAVPLPYLNTILDAARESGRSEREISRTATGQPSALSLIKTGRTPSVERVRLLCAALDLEFYIGPPRERNESASLPGGLPPDGDREAAAGDRPPPWAEALRAGIRDDLARLLSAPRRRRPGGESESDGAPARQREAAATCHVEVQKVSPVTDSNAETTEGAAASHVAFRCEWLKRHGIDPDRCAVLGVEGESMEPTVPDGSLVLVDFTRRRLRSGRVFVVRSGDGLSVKRAGKDGDGGWRLVSDHPGWPDERWPENAECEVIGEVRWVATLLA